MPPAQNEKLQPSQLQHMINSNYKAMTRWSIDLEVIPSSYKGHKFIVAVNDEVTNFMIAILIHQSKSEEVRDALIKHVFSKCSICIPTITIMDQDSAFMSSLFNYLFKK